MIPPALFQAARPAGREADRTLAFIAWAVAVADRAFFAMHSWTTLGPLVHETTPRVEETTGNNAFAEAAAPLALCPDVIVFVGVKLWGWSGLQAQWYIRTPLGSGLRHPWQ